MSPQEFLATAYARWRGLPDVALAECSDEERAVVRNLEAQAAQLAFAALTDIIINCHNKYRFDSGNRSMPSLEDQFYEIAAREIAENNLAPAAWGKALSAALGNKEKMTAFYVKFRVAQLSEEFERTWKQAVIEGQEVDCPYCHKNGKAKRGSTDFFVRLFRSVGDYHYSCATCEKTWFFENR